MAGISIYLDSLYTQIIIKNKKRDMGCSTNTLLSMRILCVFVCARGVYILDRKQINFIEIS